MGNNENEAYVTSRGWEDPSDDLINLLEVTVGDLTKSLVNNGSEDSFSLVEVAKGNSELPTVDLSTVENPPENSKTLLDLQRRITHQDERYSVIGEIGSGSEGVVFEITDKNTNQKLACKSVVTPHVGLGRIRNEAETLQKLPQTVAPKFHALIREQQRDWLFMECLGKPEWDSLAESIKDERAQENSIQILKALLENASVMEGLGIRHGDLNPSNTRINFETLTVKFVDWSNSYTGVHVGSGFGGYTPAYSSPEKSGTPERMGVDGVADNRDDLFAINIIAFQMMTGRHPFEYAKELSRVFDKKRIGYRDFWELFPTFLKNYEFSQPGFITKNPAAQKKIKQFFIKAFDQSIEKRFQTAKEGLEYLESEILESL